MSDFSTDFIHITSSEFSEPVTINDEIVNAIFDTHSNETDINVGVEVNALRPVLMVARSILSVEPVEGDPVVVRGVNYTITDVRHAEINSLVISLQDES